MCFITNFTIGGFMDVAIEGFAYLLMGFILFFMFDFFFGGK